MTNVQMDLLEREMRIHLEVEINTRTYRHFQTEFDRRLVRSSHDYENHDDDSNDDNNDNSHDTQTTHPTKLANH